MPTSSSTSSNTPKSSKCSGTLDLQLNLSHWCGSSRDLARLTIQTLDGAQVMKHASFAAKVIVPYYVKDNQMSSLTILCRLTGRFTQSKSQYLSSGNSLRLQRLLEKLLQTSLPAQEVWERQQSRQGVIFFCVKKTQPITQELLTDLQRSLKVVQASKRLKKSANTIPWAAMKRRSKLLNQLGKDQRNER